MANKKLEFLLWKKYPKNKPNKIGEYLVQWEDNGVLHTDYDNWEWECSHGNHMLENYYWLTLEHCNVISFAKAPKGFMLK